IPTEMGFSIAGEGQPMARATWHITDHIYNEFGVARGLPLTGKTLDPILDEAQSNPTGGQWFNIPQTGTLVMDELGYKIFPQKGVMAKWIRGGIMHNDGPFQDFTKISQSLLNPNGPTPTRNGATGYFFLADHQLWQIDPNGAPHRGIYGGFSFMY